MPKRGCKVRNLKMFNSIWPKKEKRKQMTAETYMQGIITVIYKDPLHEWKPCHGEGLA